MTREEMYDLIMQQVAVEVAQRVQEKLIVMQKRALVVYTGSSMGFEDGLKAMEQLRDEGFSFQVFLSQSAAAILDIEAIRKRLSPENLWIGTPQQPPEALAASYSTILVPAMTINTAAHIVNCMADTPAARIISNGMMRGKNVIINIDGCCPDNPSRAEKGYQMTPALKAQLRTNMERLRDFGARLTTAKGFYNKTMSTITKVFYPPQAAPMAATPVGVDHRKRRVIGRGEVMDCSPNSTLRVGKNALVTQLAKDAACGRGVVILKD